MKPLSVFGKTSIPSNPVEDLNIDLGKLIVYALPFRSSVDLFTLQACAGIGASTPILLASFEINGKSLQRFVFVFTQNIGVR
ncbi:hypothetical protein O9993_20725 [Vibrio lentus]|nr:hypothetical protein [Vibrio lentus]